jgi:hypothetical protein
VEVNTVTTPGVAVVVGIGRAKSSETDMSEMEFSGEGE